MVDPIRDVLNQPETRGDLDLWRSDAVARTHAAVRDAEALEAYGAALGRAGMRDAARAANRQVPELRRFDASGRRVDEVLFHPAYHDFLRLGLEAGYAAGPWSGCSHVDHAAQVYLTSQVEPGSCCPMTMTYAAFPALGVDPGLAATWQPKIAAGGYDASRAPVNQKSHVTLGMAMTEKQGGSDVRANISTAAPDGDLYRLNGHKWFCSAPMSDAFLTLAQAPEGLTCFLVPRWTEDGLNAIHFARLKDKLGNRSNASAEIEYHNALAYRLGDEGAGVRTIIEMVHHTRLDTAMAPAGLMRAALDHAHHWVTHRSAFQKRLVDQPLMQAVLADLVLDWEGATALGFRVAAAFDDPGQRPFARIGVALAKYLSNKLCPTVTYEAMEILGGMGYVEDTPMPMLYREAPLNSIWEGSGNVVCLDILRTLAREPEAEAQLNAELDAAAGANRHYDCALKDHRDRWPRGASEAKARWFAERTALLLTASVLIRNAPGPVSDAFVATRVLGERGHTRGAHGLADQAALLQRQNS